MVCQGLVFTRAVSQWESCGWLLSALLQASRQPAQAGNTYHQWETVGRGEWVLSVFGCWAEDLLMSVDSQTVFCCMPGWSSDLCMGVPEVKCVNQLYPSSACWTVSAEQPLFITPGGASSPSALTPRHKVSFSDPFFGISQLDSASQGLRKVVPLLHQG